MQGEGRTREQQCKARAARVSRRPVWMHWSAVACGLWSRVNPASSGFEPCAAYRHVLLLRLLRSVQVHEQLLAQ